MGRLFYYENRTYFFNCNFAFINGEWNRSRGRKNDITPAIAKKAAIFHILNDIQTDTNSEWKGGKVTLSKAQTVFDLNNEVRGYLFNIQVNGQDAGFVFIGNSLDEYPVLSFS
ncbi:hypothetical protein [Thermoanaerobacter thermocopriae]|uniref:hypothetical protein n=1 Tax=Thermoanaerobacter thermocopriae TaxID=29350 RepID=UPI000490B7CC|nr:hypothetical protein [Thermoanaerobacter thermocopriae]